MVFIPSADNNEVDVHLVLYFVRIHVCVCVYY